jgi:hemerythrin-like metal-binding protein
MDPLQFTDDLLTGYDAVDRQHRVMFEAARKVLAVREAGRAAVVEAVRFLLDYVQYHFLAEEHAMAAAGYDRMDLHVRQHALIRKEVLAIREAAAQGDEPRALFARIQVLFQDWYVVHIREVDRPFSQFLRARQEAGEREVPLPSSRTLVAQGRLDPECDGIELPAGPTDAWFGR